ncbi:hypothetical protein DAI22_10g034300 [Oryza sativa Japonica Group]|nr:hypothetical protein DAI22_10g034300 [Oryza sativa Japonica Group]
MIHWRLMSNHARCRRHPSVICWDAALCGDAVHTEAAVAWLHLGATLLLLTTGVDEERRLAGGAGSSDHAIGVSSPSPVDT